MRILSIIFVIFCVPLDFIDVVTIVSHKINAFNDINDQILENKTGDFRKQRIVRLICASNVIGREQRGGRGLDLTAARH